MQTESAFTERFMLIVMNGSCWSGKEEGQTEGETFSEMEKKPSDLNKLNDSCVCACVCVCFIHLVRGYYLITPRINYPFPPV